MSKKLPTGATPFDGGLAGTVGSLKARFAKPAAPKPASTAWQTGPDLGF